MPLFFLLICSLVSIPFVDGQGIYCGSSIVDVDNTYSYEKRLAISNTLFADADIDADNVLQSSKKFLHFSSPVGNRVTVPDTFSSHLPIADWSFSFWFMHDSPYTTSAAYSIIISNRPCSCYQGFFFSFSCTALSPMLQYYYNNFEKDHAFVHSPDTWFHMTVVFSNSDIKMYVDGEYMNQFTNTNFQSYDVSTSHDFLIGGDISTTSRFIGYIARVHFFDQALTAQEIYADYSTANANFDSLLIDIHLEYNSNDEQLIVDNETETTIAYLGTSHNVDAWDPRWMTLYWNETAIVDVDVDVDEVTTSTTGYVATTRTDDGFTSTTSTTSTSTSTSTTGYVATDSGTGLGSTSTSTNEDELTSTTGSVTVTVNVTGGGSLNNSNYGDDNTTATGNVDEDELTTTTIGYVSTDTDDELATSTTGYVATGDGVDSSSSSTNTNDYNTTSVDEEEDGDGDEDEQMTGSVTVSVSVTDDGSLKKSNDDDDNDGDGDNRMMLVVVVLSCAICVLLLMLAYQIYKNVVLGKMSEIDGVAAIVIDVKNQNGNTSSTSFEGVAEESDTIIYD